MGRPLKIAKAQAVITITATTTSTNVVTTSANLTNLGIIANMPFIPATTVGGLVGGTTYYILQVLSATTFTASATELSANPTYTPVTLTTTTGQTVAATVGLVDSGFNNPAGSANTYGVVGGNTAFFGNQTLVNVAIGVNGTGTLYAFNNSNVVGGVGTDLGNVPADNSIIQYVDSSGGLVTLGYVDTSTGTANIEISNATATGNFLTTVGNAETLFANLPVTLTANIGGLTAGTTYFVKDIPNAAAFTVSLAAGGANVGLTNANVTSYALQDTTLLAADATANISGASYLYATPEAGFIVRQKGKTKYLVTGSTSGLTAPCFTANVANTALTPNTFNILGTYADNSTVFVQSLSDYRTEVFPTTVAAGSLAGGTVYTIESVGTTDFTAVGAFANMTGITFVATGAGSGTGTAVLATVDPDVIGTFNTAEDANSANGLLNPVISINKV
jgi:hypothetical protein